MTAPAALGESIARPITAGIVTALVGFTSAFVVVLTGLKGVGEKAMELLVEERHAKGRFQSLDDFARRVDPRLLNKRQVEALAGAGGFDSIAPDRPGVYAAAETILAVAQRTHANRESGQGDYSVKVRRG